MNRIRISQWLCLVVLWAIILHFSREAFEHKNRITVAAQYAVLLIPSVMFLVLAQIALKTPAWSFLLGVTLAAASLLMSGLFRNGFWMPGHSWRWVFEFDVNVRDAFLLPLAASAFFVAVMWWLVALTKWFRHAGEDNSAK
jgi:hypothetical protein